MNSPSYVYSIAKSLADKDYTKDLGVDKSQFPDDLFSEKAVMNQFSDSFAPSYIPAPLMITPGENNVYIKTTHSEVYHMTPQEISLALALSISLKRRTKDRLRQILI